MIFEFWIVISGIFSVSCYVVEGPLVRDWEGECVPKEIFIFFAGGDEPKITKGGRTTSLRTKMFDNTIGFLGEDDLIWLISSSNS